MDPHWPVCAGLVCGLPLLSSEILPSKRPPNPPGFPLIFSLLALLCPSDSCPHFELLSFSLFSSPFCFTFLLFSSSGHFLFKSFSCSCSSNTPLPLAKATNAGHPSFLLKSVHKTTEILILRAFLEGVEDHLALQLLQILCGEIERSRVTDMYRLYILTIIFQIHTVVQGSQLWNSANFAVNFFPACDEGKFLIQTQQ